MCKIAIKKLVLISGMYRVMFRFSDLVLFHGHNTPKEPIIKPNIKDCIVLLYLLKVMTLFLIITLTLLQIQE